MKLLYSYNLQQVGVAKGMQNCDKFKKDVVKNQKMNFILLSSTTVNRSRLHTTTTRIRRINNFHSMINYTNIINRHIYVRNGVLFGKSFHPTTLFILYILRLCSFYTKKTKLLHPHAQYSVSFDREIERRCQKRIRANL